jgi:hypothetical protein
MLLQIEPGSNASDPGFQKNNFLARLIRHAGGETASAPPAAASKLGRPLRKPLSGARQANACL